MEYGFEFLRTLGSFFLLLADEKSVNGHPKYFNPLAYKKIQAKDNDDVDESI